MKFRNKLFKQVNNLIESKLIPRRNKTSNDLNNKFTLKNPYAQEENLFSNKTNKEILLYQIKSMQMSLLLPNKSIPKEEKINNIKKILIDFKQSLIYMLIQKNTKRLFLKKKINDKKRLIQNKLFNADEQKGNNKKNIKEIEILEKNYGDNELSKLKTLNFEAENDIGKLNFMIESGAYLINYLNMTNTYPEEKNEIIYNFQKSNSKDIEYALISQMHKEKETLNQINKLKNGQNKEIIQIKKEIEDIKKHIESEKFVFENKSISNYSKLYNTFFDNYLNNINNDDFFVVSNINKNIRVINMQKNNYNSKIKKYISGMINKSLTKNNIKNTIYLNRSKSNNIILRNKEIILRKRLTENKIIIH